MSFKSSQKGVKSKSGTRECANGLGVEYMSVAGLVQFIMFILPPRQDRGKVGSRFHNPGI